MTTPRRQWPAANVEMWPVEKVLPYARNPRTHSDEQVAAIAASMQEFGWTNPALVTPEGRLIAGHGRLLAAQRLGYTDVPVMVAHGWTKAQQQAYVIADNQLAVMGSGWDEGLLKIELKDLELDGFDLGLLGFSGIELEGLLAVSGGQEGADPDEVPDTPETPVSALGDLWVMDRHRLLCGDATSAQDVERVLAGVKPHLMVTDPPYGVEYDASWRNDAIQGLVGRPRADGKKGGGGRAIGKVSNDGQADWTKAWALFPGDVAYVWCAGTKSHIVALSLEACRFTLRAMIVWAKSQFSIGRGNYHEQKEPCWYVVREGKTGHWNGDRKQSTLWQIAKPHKSESGHSTQKPIECMQRPIENNSSPGQAVYEPFSGSGTTIIAGEATGRSILALEINPAYVDVAVMRWQTFTGKAATLEGDGRTFDEVKAERTQAPGP